MPDRAAQPSVTEISIATIGVLFRNTEAIATGAQRRMMATLVDFGEQSRGSRINSTARVSSSARAMTKSTPMTINDAEEAPRHASALVMTLVSCSSVVEPNITMSGGASLAISNRETSTSHMVKKAAGTRHFSLLAQIGSGKPDTTASAVVPSSSTRRLLQYLASHRNAWRPRRRARRAASCDDAVRMPILADFSLVGVAADAAAASAAGAACVQSDRQRQVVPFALTLRILRPWHDQGQAGK